MLPPVPVLPGGPMFLAVEPLHEYPPAHPLSPMTFFTNPPLVTSLPPPFAGPVPMLLPQGILPAELAVPMLTPSPPSYPMGKAPQFPIVSSSEMEGRPAQGTRSRHAPVPPQAVKPETGSTSLPLKAAGPVDEQGNQSHHYWPLVTADLYNWRRLLDFLIMLKNSLVS